MDVENLSITVKTTGADKAAKQIDSLAEALGKLETASSSMTGISNLSSLANAVNTISGSSVSVRTFNSLSKGIASLGDALKGVTSEDIENLDKIVNSLSKLQGVNLQGFGSAVGAAKKVSQSAQAVTPPPVSSEKQEYISTMSEVELLEKKLFDLKAAMNAAFAEGNVGKATAIRAQIIATEKALERAKNSADSMRNSLKRIADQSKKTNDTLKKFTSSLGRIAGYRALRTIIKSITQGFSEGLKNAYHWSKQFSQSVEGSLGQSLDNLSAKSLMMKNQMGSAFGALLQAIMPIIMQIVSLITTLMRALSALFSAIGGGQYLVAKETANAWDKATGGAQKYRNVLLGFDEINRLDDQSGGGGGGGASLEDMFEEGKLPAWAQKIADWKDMIAEKLGGSLAGLETLLYDAAMVIGAVLLFSGANIPLGLGLLVAGFIGRYNQLTENWENMTPKVKGAITAIENIVGKALIALGIILTLSGANIPLGLGLIATGAVMLATQKQEGWDYVPRQVQAIMTEIQFVASAAMLALGIIFVLSGVNVPLGLGLMVAGAVGLATMKAEQWNVVPTKVKNILAIITEITSYALIALGIIFSLTGNLPLGLGLLAAGVATKYASTAVLWDYLPQQIRQKLTEIATLTSIAMLALGIILLFAGHPALGIGLILASCVLASQIASFDLDGTTASINGALDSVGSNGETQLGKIVTALQTIVMWVDKVVTGFQSIVNNARSVKSRLDDVQSYKNMYGDVWGEVVRGSELGLYAGGGFPDVGEVFIARESGAELVGSIGGRTAVANNDEIVEAVSSGVYEAVSAAMGNGNERPVKVQVYLDSREIRTGQNRLARAMGV